MDSRPEIALMEGGQGRSFRSIWFVWWFLNAKIMDEVGGRLRVNEMDGWVCRWAERKALRRRCIIRKLVL